jgi:nucleoside-diphosphate-sugar epimerase
VIGARGYAGSLALEALGERVRVRAAEPHDDLAAAMLGVEVVHVAAELRSPFERLRRGRRWQPHPLLVRVVGLAREAGVRRIVHLSSASAFGLARDGHVSERTPPRPEHAYERLLAGDEAWLRDQARPEVVVLRPAQPFGPGEPLLSALVRALAAGRLALPGGGRARRTFLAGADLGRAFVAAALRGEPGGAYLVGGFEGSWRQLLVAAAMELSLPPRIGWHSYDLAYLAAAARLPLSPVAAECWPTPFLVDVLGRSQVVEDGWSRRELSWRPEVLCFGDGLAGLAERSAAVAANPPVISPGPGAPSEA